MNGYNMRRSKVLFSSLDDDDTDMSLLFKKSEVNLKADKAEMDDKDDKSDKDDLADKRTEHITQGLVGFVNLGNTCYMNAALQVLSNTPIGVYLRENMYKSRLYYNIVQELGKATKKEMGLEPDDQKTPIELDRKKMNLKYNNSLTYQLSRLQRAMWNMNCIITPTSFKKAVGMDNKTFSGTDQHDSQEFLAYLLDRIHEETKAVVDVSFCKMPQGVRDLLEVREKCNLIMKDPNATIYDKESAKQCYENYKEGHCNDAIILDAFISWKEYVRSHSIISDLFTGMFHSVIEPECGNNSVRFEAFSTISIETAPEGETTLEQCLKDFSSEELLNGDDKYFCSKCKRKEDAKKNIYIWEAPEILIIQLKRFKTEYIKQINQARTFKTNSVVKFPLEGLRLTDNYTELSRDDKLPYDLIGIIRHMGGCSGGHYVAYCLNPINKEWYEFNDSTVVHIPKDEIQKEVVTKDAYVLIYQKNRSVDIEASN